MKPIPSAARQALNKALRDGEISDLDYAYLASDVPDSRAQIIWRGFLTGMASPLLWLRDKFAR